MNKRGHVINAVLLAIGIGYILEPSGKAPTFEAMATVGMPVLLGALLPDVDTAFGEHRQTLHNLPVLGALYGWPWWFGTVQHVWIGVLTHYVLDVVGNRRGMALVYPLSETEYDLPIGVSTTSRFAEVVTIAVTAFELAAIYLILRFELPVTDLPQQIGGLL